MSLLRRQKSRMVRVYFRMRATCQTGVRAMLRPVSRPWRGLETGPAATGRGLRPVSDRVATGTGPSQGAGQLPKKVRSRWFWTTRDRKSSRGKVGFDTLSYSDSLLEVVSSSSAALGMTKTHSGCRIAFVRLRAGRFSVHPAATPWPHPATGEHRPAEAQVLSLL